MDGAHLSPSHGAAGPPAPFSRRLAERLLSRLRGRRALVLAAIAFTAAGLALGWPWLATAGLAPLVVSLLPCAAMCAVGLCTAGKGDERSCHAVGSPRSAADSLRSNA